MPTSGPVPITPRRGFFPGATSMFNPTLSLRFRENLYGVTDGVWNEGTKIMSSVAIPCTGPAVGKQIHVWKPGPINEDWAVVDACSNGDYSIPALNVPTGSNYYFTIGGTFPLYLQMLFQELFAFYGGMRAYAFRWGALWTTVYPADCTHSIEVLHFDGWPD